MIPRVLYLIPGKERQQMCTIQLVLQGSIRGKESAILRLEDRRTDTSLGSK